MTPLFIAFSFIDQWAGHTAMAAQRTIIVTPVRMGVQLALALFFVIPQYCPSSMLLPPTERCQRAAATRFWLLVATNGLIVCLALLCRALPIPPALRLPHVAPPAPTPAGGGRGRGGPLGRWLRSLRGFLCWSPAFTAIVMADTFDDLFGVLDAIQLLAIVVRFRWSPLHIGVTTAHVGLLALAFAFTATSTAIPGTLVVIAVALLVYPPMPLATFILESVALEHSSGGDDKRPHVHLVLVVALILVKRVATSLLRLRLSPSRWKYVYANVYATVLGSACAALSPLLFLQIAYSVLGTDALPPQALVRDDRILRTLLVRPLASIPQFLLQLLAVRLLPAEGVTPHLQPAHFDTPPHTPSPAARRRRVASSLCSGGWWLLQGAAAISSTSLILLYLLVECPEWLPGKAFLPKQHLLRTRPHRTSRSVTGKSIYMLIVDRFAKAADTVSSPLALSYDCFGDLFCGGNIRGITEQLDYIEGMGFECVWVTPVTQQFSDKYDCFNHQCGTPFHGYWTENHYAVDGRFGTQYDLMMLSRELKKRNMCLIMDIVVNHVRPIHTLRDLSAVYPFSSPDHYNTFFPKRNGSFVPCAAEPNRHERARCFAEYAKRPRQATENQEQIGCALGTGDWCPGYEPQVTLDGWFYDLADLNQSHPYVRAELTRWVRYLVKQYDLTALRLDTAPYMPLDFLSELQRAVDVEILGELTTNELPYHASFTHDPATGESVLAGAFNFPLSTSMLEAFSPRHPGSAGGWNGGAYGAQQGSGGYGGYLGQQGSGGFGAQQGSGGFGSTSGYFDGGGGADERFNASHWYRWFHAPREGDLRQVARVMQIQQDPHGPYRRPGLLANFLDSHDMPTRLPTIPPFDHTPVSPTTPPFDHTPFLPHHSTLRPHTRLPRQEPRRC